MGWLFTTMGAMLLALVFARLSRKFPASGGPYVYAREGLGEFAGFLIAWGYWISIWSGNAAIAIALVGNLTVFFPLLKTNAFSAALTAIGSVWLLTWLNSTGIKNAGVFQFLSTVLKLIPLLLLSVFGFYYFEPAHFSPFNVSGQSTFSAISATATLTLWALLGLESSTIPAGNIKDPEKTIPRATLIGTALAAVIYIFSTTAVMGILSPDVLVNSSAPFADAANKIWGNAAGYFIAAGAVISCFGALNGWILLQAQIPMAAAHDRLFPSVFKKLSKKNTPLIGLVVSSILISALIFMNYTKSLVEQFTFIILTATLSTLIPYVFSTTVDLIVLIREKQRLDRPRFIRSFTLSILAFIFSLWTIYGAGPETVFWGFLSLLASLPVYVWIKYKYQDGVQK